MERCIEYVRSRRYVMVFDICLLLAFCWVLLAPTSSSTVGPVLTTVETTKAPWKISEHSKAPHRHLGKRRRKKKWHSEAGGVSSRVAARAEASAQSATPSSHSCDGVTQSTDACPASSRRVVVTLSIGNRSHFNVIRVPMEAYAKRVGADFAVVDSRDHPSLARWNSTLSAGTNSHFMKLPLLQYFLGQYDQVMFIDDDVLLSPHAANVFASVPCSSVGATVEGLHKQGWHTMHGRAFCDIYNLKESHPATCGTEAVKQARIFNSGVMVLSAAHHKRLIDGWDAKPLECRILCDQLYMNAMVTKHKVCVHDLGSAYNLPGTIVRKNLMTTRRARRVTPEGTPLASSCFVHLTVLPSKQKTSHYLLQRALQQGDIMRCDGEDVSTGTAAAARPHSLSPTERSGMLGALPTLRYDIEKIWCKGKGKGCQLIAVTAPSTSNATAAAPIAAAAPRVAVDTAQCAAHRAAAAMAEPPLPPTVGNSSELPFGARQVLHRAASTSWDCNTVILLFATADFFDLAINWAQAATSIGITNFALVAMDKPLGDILARFNAPPGIFLPRVAAGDVTITKLNVIGERQRFGLRVLEAGFNVLFADLDAILLRNPAPILADGDIIGERIWGRPLSVVKTWGAGICTGFYFLRSNANTIAIFQRTHRMIVDKRARQKKWQASDQWAINHAVDDSEVEWQTPMPMKGMSDYHTKYVDETPAIGYTKAHRSKFVVLPHLLVARSCPILKHGTEEPPAEERVERKKYRLWRTLLSKSYALHCFPPDSMPCPGQKHGEKGCDKSVIMGSAVHIHGEVVFDQRQGLWFMKEGWEEAIRSPSSTDFFAWLRTQHNGARPGEPPPRPAP